MRVVTPLLLLLVSLALVAACGLFVAAEFSLVTVDRPSVERAAASGDEGARGVQLALRSLSTQLSGAQVGITVTNLAIGFLSEPAIADLIDDLDSRHAGLKGRLITEQGGLHRFVNVYVNDEDVRFLGGLDTQLSDGDSVTVLPAVAGG